MLKGGVPAVGKNRGKQGAKTRLRLPTSVRHPRGGEGEKIRAWCVWTEKRTQPEIKRTPNYASCKPYTGELGVGGVWGPENGLTAGIAPH